MSHKTYCDRCGAECTGRFGHLHLGETHATNQAEVVAQDDYKPIDLCGHCIDAVKAFIGPAMVVFRYEHGPVAEEMAMARPVQPFFPADSPSPPG